MVSRVAKNPVAIPSGVEVKVGDGFVSVKGKHGEIKQILHRSVNVTQDGKQVVVVAKNTDRHSDAAAGTIRAIVNNMVHGVSQGFERKLVLVGVGYRAKAEGKKLHLTVGFSHPVEMTMPEGVTVETPSVTEVIVKGANKHTVSQVAANIRAVRPPEPYKGKGIRYANEQITLKEAKKK
jgi:large subunit ribosomal protein L6